MARKHIIDYLAASDRLVCRACLADVDDPGEECPVAAMKFRQKLLAPVLAETLSLPTRSRRSSRRRAAY